MKSGMDRRRFLGSALGGAGLLIVPARTAFTYQANERLNLAIVGTFGYCAGAYFFPQLHTLDNVSITTVCDVDDRKLARAYGLWEERARQWANSENPTERRGAELYSRLLKDRPVLYRDFRKMLEERDRQIDAVVCATPDHTHAIVSAHALRAGKHVLAEKPLTLRVEEARALRKRAAENPELATSMGNQGTQTLQFRRGVELIREEAIGPVEEVHVWFSRGGQDHRQPPQGEEAIPPELQWDLWLGPAAARPYHSRWIARNHWRDTTIGELGNMGPHDFNMAFMGLNIGDLWRGSGGGSARAPIRVSAEVPNINPLSFPKWERIQWKVPARGSMPPVTIRWHHAPVRELPPGSRELLLRMMVDRGLAEEKAAARLQDRGALIVGSKGAIATNGANTAFLMLPEEQFRDVPQDRPLSLPVSLGHYKDWLAACRGGARPLANFDYATRLMEFLDLGDLATRFGGDDLEYDPVTGNIPHHSGANQRLACDYRPGWTL